jgi:thiamine kinase-like enzyme
MEEMKSLKGVHTPSRPSELDKLFLEYVLNHDFLTTQEKNSDKTIHVKTFSWRPMEVGVISEVVSISIHAETKGQNEEMLHIELVGKFFRPEFPFETMFQVESNFYNQFQHKSSKRTLPDFPFDLPRAVFTSKVLILLERVPSVVSYSCFQGCPRERVVEIIERLARMHGKLKHYDCSSLAKPAGIGSALTGKEKKEQFGNCWKNFLDDVPLAPEEKAKVTKICEELAANPQKLEDIHNAVDAAEQTFIHGDFHVSNMLFDRSYRSTWLLDWATCGKGNPMRDFAFFFIVAVSASARRRLEQTCLEGYYQTIIKEGFDQYNLEQWKHQYHLCILNQFLILVVYDKLSKQLANNAKTEKLRTELHQHFKEVNFRCCLLLLDHFDSLDWSQV